MCGAYWRRLRRRSSSWRDARSSIPPLTPPVKPDYDPTAEAAAAAIASRSEGHATLAHPFSTHPDWVKATWEEDHPVMFWGVEYPLFLCEALVFGTIGWCISHNQS